MVPSKQLCTPLSLVLRNPVHSRPAKYPWQAPVSESQCHLGAWLAAMSTSCRWTAWAPWDRQISLLSFPLLPCCLCFLFVSPNSFIFLPGHFNHLSITLYTTTDKLKRVTNGCVTLFYCHTWIGQKQSLWPWKGRCNVWVSRNAVPGCPPRS